MKNKLNSINYNTAQGINNYITDIATLHEVIDARYQARENNEILNDFMWRGKLLFDSFGQTSMITEQEYSRNAKYETEHNTLSRERFVLNCPRYTTSFSRQIPQANVLCPQCEKAFVLSDITDCVDGFHKMCKRLNNNEKQLEEFKYLFEKVYSASELKYKAIPSQYCPHECCAAWFIVSTPDGKIKIGRRKRVDCIIWLDNYKPFAEKFECEQVTKEFLDERFIHAWTNDKIIEYLKKAKESIIK